MAIYMNFNSKKTAGNVTAKGYEDWIELDSYSFGCHRSVTMEAGAMSNREASRPTINEVTFTKKLDAASGGLFKESVTGSEGVTVQIDIVQTGADSVQTFASAAPAQGIYRTAVQWLQHALAFVVGKCLSALGGSYSMLTSTTSTIMDRLAWILSRGVILEENLSAWVVHLMRKMAEFLGMARRTNTEKPGKDLIRYLLEQLSQKVNQMARSALSQVLADGRAV